MDANGLNFWMLNTASDWLPAGGSSSLAYCPDNGRLQLRSRRLGNPPTEDYTTAAALVETTPMCRDSLGTYARWDAGTSTVVAGGSASTGEVTIYTPPTGQTVSDLAMGYDGVLYIAVGGALVLLDRRNRWPQFTLNVPGFTFWRLSALPDGGALALDRTTPQLGVVAGLPLQLEPTDEPNPGVLRSCQPNANPPQLIARYPLPGTEAFVGFTVVSASRFYLLSWGAMSPTNRVASLRSFDRATGLGNAWALTETAFPYAIAWLDQERFALLATGLKEALIYDLQGAPTQLVPAGDTYILKGPNAGPFAHSLDGKVYYSYKNAILPLLPLSLNSLAQTGREIAPKLIDSGSAQTIWHRLFVEAIVPPPCGVVIWLAASNRASDFSPDATTSPVWYPHVLGTPMDPTLALPAETPQAVWLSIPSEVPFARPLLDETPIKGRQGLFMVLIQRAATAVRNLTGRYLGVQIELSGDQRSTPQIAALRAYASRFSYVTHYLPQLYREGKFGADADVPGESTRRDFLERFVNLFEGQMTRIEDFIVHSYLLTRPECTPDAALDWLGGWIGLDPSGYPPDRRRARLLAAPDLHRKRGTIAGISAALDVATNGLCQRGAVLVIEAFRLRHIFATILGSDLADRNDPLLPGYASSSNSFVGDTLFLGDPRNPDFLALFASSDLLPAQQQEVQAFLDSLAWRILVFIHNQVEAVNVNLVQQIVESEKPAHVLASYQIATQPFMIGLASLLGANSYLAPETPSQPVTVDASRVGRYNLIEHLPSLDPRFETGGPL